jgi:hypothetical protein
LVVSLLFFYYLICLAEGFLEIMSLLSRGTRVTGPGFWGYHVIKNASWWRLVVAGRVKSQSLESFKIQKKKKKKKKKWASEKVAVQRARARNGPTPAPAQAAAAHCQGCVILYYYLFFWGGWGSFSWDPWLTK